MERSSPGRASVFAGGAHGAHGVGRVDVSAHAASRSPARAAAAAQTPSPKHLRPASPHASRTPRAPSTRVRLASADLAGDPPTLIVEGVRARRTTTNPMENAGLSGLSPCPQPLSPLELAISSEGIAWLETVFALADDDGFVPIDPVELNVDPPCAAQSDHIDDATLDNLPPTFGAPPAPWCHCRSPRRRRAAGRAAGRAAAGRCARPSRQRHRRCRRRARRPRVTRARAASRRSRRRRRRRRGPRRRARRATTRSGRCAPNTASASAGDSQSRRPASFR